VISLGDAKMGKIEKNTLVVITKEKMETIGVVKSKAGGTVWQVNLFGYPDYMTHGFEERELIPILKLPSEGLEAELKPSLNASLLLHHQEIIQRLSKKLAENHRELVKLKPPISYQ